jgi:hypothetical protein
MEINRAAIGALAVVGVVAASAGAFIAGRHSAPVTTEPALTLQESHSGSVPGPVTETENSIAAAPAIVESPTTNNVAPARPAAPTPLNTVRRESSASRARTAPPVADRSRPAYSRPSQMPPSAPVDPPVAATDRAAGAPGSREEALESTTVERAPVVPEPPQKVYEELIVPADSVIGLQVENTVSSDRAKVEDQVRARVTRDVRVHEQVAIPAGARAEGSITLVDKGGRLKDQARLGIRFHTIVLADGTRLPINTETIYRDGESPARESAAKIGGGAVGGAVLGAILGGKKGAIIGSTVGAGAGGAAVAASEPNAATLPAGSTVTVRMSSPATVTVEK